MTSVELWEHDAEGQATLVRDGTVQPRELVEAAINRVEERRDLNAVVIDLFDHAEQALQRGVSGPFAGVAILLKDACQETHGPPHWMGQTLLHRLQSPSPNTTPVV